MAIVASVSMEIFISKNVFDFLKAFFFGQRVEIFQEHLFAKTEYLAKTIPFLNHKTFSETFKTSSEMS